MVRIDRDKHRVWVCGARIHHGLLGVAVIAVGHRVRGPMGRVLLLAGAHMVMDDLHDFPWLQDGE